MSLRDDMTVYRVAKGLSRRSAAAICDGRLSRKGGNRAMHPIWNTMTLGEVIDALKPLEPRLEVRFDFGAFEPEQFHSYRGDYSHLALGYRDPWSHEAKVGRLAHEAALALEETFGGWKGGEYRMTRDTPVWIAQNGECPGTTLVSIEQLEHFVLLRTGWQDY